MRLKSTGACLMPLVVRYPHSLLSVHIHASYCLLPPKSFPQPPSPYLPYEFTMEGMLERIMVYLEHQVCADKALTHCAVFVAQ